MRVSGFTSYECRTFSDSNLYGLLSLNFVFEAISMVYINCLNYRIKENNFWEPTPDTSRPTVRALVQNPRITALRKQRALERNRPIGRPPKTKRQGVG
jgi:hypothetical protein